MWRTPSTLSRTTQFPSYNQQSVVPRLSASKLQENNVTFAFLTSYMHVMLFLQVGSTSLVLHLLPSEVLIILSYLSVRDLSNCMMVARGFIT